VADPAGVVFGVLVPLAAAALGVALTKHWEHRLPARMATHWRDRGPDSFAAPMSAAGTYALVIVLVGGGVGAVAALERALLLMRRTLLIVCLTVVGVMTSAQLTTLVAQLDHTDVSRVRLPWSMIPIGALCGLMLGVLAASLLRDHRVRTPATVPPAAALPRLPAAGPVRDIVGFGRTGTVVFVTVTLAVVGWGCAADGAIWPLAVAGPVVLTLAGLMRFDVTAGPDGVRVRNFGMVSLDLSAAEIAGATVLEVSPFRDYGGWGLRRGGHGDYGIVTKTGPAVRIDTASGMSLVVTTERASIMAGAINVWADRRAGRAAGSGPAHQSHPMFP
jgi:hypothetical protein